MTRAVLFDFGGVFTDSPFEAAEALGRELGAPRGRLLEIVFGPYHEDGDHPWHRLERGELSLVDAREEILALGRAEGLEVDPFQIFGRMGGRGARGEFVERARSAREAGLRTGLVTNNAREFRDGWRGLVPVDELFEIVIDSSEVGVRKPDPRIFELALEALGGLAAEQTVFLDDYAANLRAAEALGMRTVLVESDPSQALRALDAILAASR